jgi:alpha-1,3-fucosyltransferase
MTNRLDSDIPWPYGEVTDIQTGKVVAPAMNIKWKTPEMKSDNSKQTILDIFKKKTKTATWFVTNCVSTPSNRMGLVQKLRENGVDVEIFGGCVNSSLNLSPEEQKSFLEDKYKFYFAFENSLCDDYVTEKLYKVMDSIIIPVVYSGADMSRFAPPMSYVDANSFKTVEDLAKHLKFLAENPEEYAKYFWWRKHYKIRTIEQFDFDAVHRCRICQKFNDPYMKFKQQVYTDIYEWFHHGSCKEPSIKF